MNSGSRSAADMEAYGLTATSSGDDWDEAWQRIAYVISDPVIDYVKEERKRAAREAGSIRTRLREREMKRRARQSAPRSPGRRIGR